MLVANSQSIKILTTDNPNQHDSDSSFRFRVATVLDDSLPVPHTSPPSIRKMRSVHLCDRLLRDRDTGYRVQGTGYGVQGTGSECQAEETGESEDIDGAAVNIN
jgi:hypothetical protein